MEDTYQGVRGLAARVVAWRAGGSSLRILRRADPPAFRDAGHVLSSIPSSSAYQLLPQMATTLYDKQAEAAVDSQVDSDLDNIEVDWTEAEEKALVRK